MSKKIAITVGVILALCVAAFIVVYKNLDEIVRRTTERVMSYALQVDVTVGGATVKPTQGDVELRDVVIANPPGYQSEYAMKFDRIRAKVDIGSFRTDEPVVDFIRLSGAEIVMELKRWGSNLQDLVDNASRFSSGKGGKKEEPSQKAYKIKQVLLDRNTVRVAIPFLGGKTVDVPIPDIQLRNLGGEKGKVSMSEALQVFLGRVLASIKNQATGKMPSEALASIGDTVKGLSDHLGEFSRDLGGGLKDVSDKAQSTLQEGAEGIGEAVQSATEGIGGLLGSKGKKDKK